MWDWSRIKKQKDMEVLGVLSSFVLLDDNRVSNSMYVEREISKRDYTVKNNYIILINFNF